MVSPKSHMHVISIQSSLRILHPRIYAYHDKRTGKTYVSIRFETLTCAEFNQYREMFYVNGVKGFLWIFTNISLLVLLLSELWMLGLLTRMALGSIFGLILLLSKESNFSVRLFNAILVWNALSINSILIILSIFVLLLFLPSKLLLNLISMSLCYIS